MAVDFKNLSWTFIFIFAFDDFFMLMHIAIDISEQDNTQG